MKGKQVDTESNKKSKSQRPSKRYAVMRSFSQFLKAAIDRAGHTPTSFARAYKLVDQTVLNYTNQNRIPDFTQLDKLAKALNHALPEENITNITLISLLYPVEGDSMGLEDALRSFEPLPWPHEIVEWFGELPFHERRAIAPLLSKQITMDLELSSDNPLHVLAVLVRRELSTLKVGPDTFAKKYEIPLAITEQILQGEDPLNVPTEIKGLDLSIIRKLANNVRDHDKEFGNLKLFLKLCGWPVEIRDFLQSFMAEQGLRNSADLVDYCLGWSSSTKGDVDRQGLMDSVEAIFRENEVPSNTDPVYATIISKIEKEMGFVNSDEFLAVVLNGAEKS